MGSTADASGSEGGSPAESDSDGEWNFNADRERPRRESLNRDRAGMRGTDPGEDDLSKEELKAKLQRKQWGSRLRGLIWLFLIAMNLYLAYLIFSMVI